MARSGADRVLGGRRNCRNSTTAWRWILPLSTAPGFDRLPEVVTEHTVNPMCRREKLFHVLAGDAIAGNYLVQVYVCRWFDANGHIDLALEESKICPHIYGGRCREYPDRRPEVSRRKFVILVHCPIVPRHEECGEWKPATAAFAFPPRLHLVFNPGMTIILPVVDVAFVATKSPVQPQSGRDSIAQDASALG